MFNLLLCVLSFASSAYLYFHDKNGIASLWALTAGLGWVMAILNERIIKLQQEAIETLTEVVVGNDEWNILNDRIFEQQQQIFEALSQKLQKSNKVTKSVTGAR